MSVINQMLRDLDQRNVSLDLSLRAGTAVVPPTSSAPANVLQPSQATLHLQTAPRAGQPAQSTQQTPRASASVSVPWAAHEPAVKALYREVLLRWALLALLFGLAVGAWWWEQGSDTDAATTSDVLALAHKHAGEQIGGQVGPREHTLAPLSPPAAHAASRSVAARPIGSASAGSASARKALPVTPLATPPASLSAVAGAADAVAPATTAATNGTAPSAVARAQPAAVQVTGQTVAAASSGADALALVQRQHNASREVLAQAQALYNSGSTDAALALLRDAWRTAAQASPALPAAASLALLRELARMELALGHASAVLELLASAEPLLNDQPDLWALRANAAQRLGRHAEAVHWYATALQSRPAETRWLLSSAVSLAALGQIGRATEMADKARASGPVSKEVLLYLRQQGVLLNDR